MGLGEVDQLGQLRLQQPGVERETEAGEPGVALAERIGQVKPSRCARERAQHVGIGVPRAAVADAAESVGDLQVRLQHLVDPFAEGAVGVADDAGAGAHIAVDAARRHGRDAVDELGLAHRLHVLGPVGPIHRPALHEDGGDDVVAAAQVGEQLLQQVTRRTRPNPGEAVGVCRKVGCHWRAPASTVPQMMVRIDDRQFGLEDRFLHALTPVGVALSPCTLSGRRGRRR